MYNYYEAVKDDIIDYVIVNEIKFAPELEEGEIFDELYEIAFYEDSITGNGSGSYTFDKYQAAKYIADNWDLLREALEEDDWDILPSAETCDVLIRLYCLADALRAAIEELF